MHSKDIFFLYYYNISYFGLINFLEMISMVFSKSSESKHRKGDILTVSSYMKPAPKTSTETTYYMQNSMIGRLMDIKKCTSCPKH